MRNILQHGENYVLGDAHAVPGDVIDVRAAGDVMVGLVADGPHNVPPAFERELHAAVLDAARMIECNSASQDGEKIVADLLNDVNRRLAKLPEGVIAAGHAFCIKGGYIYVGGVGDAVIGLFGKNGLIRFGKEDANQQRVRTGEVRYPASRHGWDEKARLGCLPAEYSREAVDACSLENIDVVMLYTDGLDFVAPDFDREVTPNMTWREIFDYVNDRIPENDQALRDDVSFAIIPVQATVSAVKEPDLLPAGPSISTEQGNSELAAALQSNVAPPAVEQAGGRANGGSSHPRQDGDVSPATGKPDQKSGRARSLRIRRQSIFLKVASLAFYVSILALGTLLLVEQRASQRLIQECLREIEESGTHLAVIKKHLETMNPNKAGVESKAAGVDPVSGKPETRATPDPSIKTDDPSRSGREDKSGGNANR